MYALIVRLTNRKVWLACQAIVLMAILMYRRVRGARAANKAKDATAPCMSGLSRRSGLIVSIQPRRYEPALHHSSVLIKSCDKFAVRGRPS